MKVSTTSDYSILNMKVSTTSNLGRLDIKDVLKGLLLAVITPVLTIILQSLEAGATTFDWKVIGGVAVSSFVAYISKNILSPGLVTIQASKQNIQEVQDGVATATIIQK